MKHHRKDFEKEESALQQYCAMAGLNYEPRELNHPVYQLARITGDGVCIIAYPHQTSARNYHIRLRDQGSKDKLRYEKVVFDLYNASGLNCTFQTKHFNANKALALRREHQ